MSHFSSRLLTQEEYCLPHFSLKATSFDTLTRMCDMPQRRLDYTMGRSDDTTSVIASDKTLEPLAVSQVEDDLTEYALKYARLDAHGREAVEAIIRAEYNRCRIENTLAVSTPYFGNFSVRKQNTDE